MLAVVVGGFAADHVAVQRSLEIEISLTRLELGRHNEVNLSAVKLHGRDRPVAAELTNKRADKGAARLPDFKPRGIVAVRSMYDEVPTPADGRRIFLAGVSAPAASAAMRMGNAELQRTTIFAKT